MASLPSLTDLSDEQVACIMDCFEGHTHDVTGEPLTPEQGYLQWLLNQVRAHVIAVESHKLQMEHAAKVEAAKSETNDTLPSEI